MTRARPAGYRTTPKTTSAAGSSRTAASRAWRPAPPRSGARSRRPAPPAGGGAGAGLSSTCKAMRCLCDERLGLPGRVGQRLGRGLLPQQRVLDLDLEDLADLVVPRDLRPGDEAGQLLLGHRHHLRRAGDDLRVVVGRGPARQRVLGVLVLHVLAGEVADIAPGRLLVLAAGADAQRHRAVDARAAGRTGRRGPHADVAGDLRLRRVAGRRV